jgi:predicted nucleic acid-binding protein
MTIVSNTSPISNLAAIGQLPLLQQIYSRITIPTAVANEIAKVGTIYTQAAAVPTLSWITIQPVTDTTTVHKLRAELDEGESEAIALAVELDAELLLIDEQLGRKSALEYGLDMTGLLGVLLEAKSQGLISSVKPMMDDLVIQARFRVSQQLYAEVLHLAGE